LLYYTAIQLRIIVSAALSIYSRYSAYTVYSDAAYTLYSAIHSPSAESLREATTTGTAFHVIAGSLT